MCLRRRAPGAYDIPIACEVSMVVWKLKPWFAKPADSQYPYGGNGHGKLHMPYDAKFERGLPKLVLAAPLDILQLSPENSNSPYSFR